MRIIILLIIAINLQAAFPEWFYKIKNSKEKKKAFVKILLPIINEENRKILLTRNKIILMFETKNFDYSFLKKVAKQYKIKNIKSLDEYLIKINTIPPSLALAQAAIESGWGNSRFVKSANNIFGHWEYSDKGVKPKSTYSHIKIKYSLKKFKSIRDSVKAYMLNLNRNRAYHLFRELRAKYLAQNKLFSGGIAASTLKNYSQLKTKYVRLIQKIIIANKWQIFDKGNICTNKYGMR